MAASVDDIDSLAVELSRLSTVEAKMEAFSRWSTLRQDTLPIVQLSSNGATNGDVGPPMAENEMRKIAELFHQHGMTSELMHGFFSHPSNSGYPDLVLDTLPCANHQVQGNTCPKAGISTCAGCKLVRYCSKVCKHHAQNVIWSMRPITVHDRTANWLIGAVTSKVCVECLSRSFKD
jgi:hypothetical protein